MLISDGANSNSYGMLATQLNALVHEEKLKEYCIFKVKKYQCNNMQGKKVIIILDLEVLQEGSEVGEKLGSPVAIAADGTVQTQSVDQNRTPNLPNNGDHKRVAQNEPAGSPATKRPSMLDRPVMGKYNCISSSIKYMYVPVFDGRNKRNILHTEHIFFSLKGMLHHLI